LKIKSQDDLIPVLPDTLICTSSGGNSRDSVCQIGHIMTDKELADTDLLQIKSKRKLVCLDPNRNKQKDHEEQLERNQKILEHSDKRIQNKCEITEMFDELKKLNDDSKKLKRLKCVYCDTVNELLEIDYANKISNNKKITCLNNICGENRFILIDENNRILSYNNDKLQIEDKRC
jgi:hypothetical protein